MLLVVFSFTMTIHKFTLKKKKVNCAEDLSVDLQVVKNQKKNLPEKEQLSFEGWEGCGKVAEGSLYLAGLCARALSQTNYNITCNQ